MKLSDLTNAQLEDRVGRLLANERRTIVDLLFHLAEIQRRRLHLERGYSSMFVYCTDALGLTKSSSFRRTTAAKLLIEFPAVEPYLRSGKLNLTTLAVLRDVLTKENHVELFERASHKTEDEVKLVVASLAPRPDPGEKIRPLSTQAKAPVSAGPELSGSSAPVSAGPEPTLAPAPAAAPERKARIDPLSEKRHLVQFSVDASFLADLETVRGLLSHKLPAGRLEDVFGECLRLAIETLEKRRRGAGEPRAGAAEPDTSGPYVPTAVKRIVWKRDGGCCTYVAPNGRRCGSRHRVQYHHLDPSGRRGPSTVENVCLRCANHNEYAAEQDFGREHMIAAGGQRSFW